MRLQHLRTILSLQALNEFAWANHARASFVRANLRVELRECVEQRVTIRALFDIVQQRSSELAAVVQGLQHRVAVAGVAVVLEAQVVLVV